jgi:hypothetical protein
LRQTPGRNPQKALDAGLKNAGMTSGETEILFSCAVLSDVPDAFGFGRPETRNDLEEIAGRNPPLEQPPVTNSPSPGCSGSGTCGLPRRHPPIHNSSIHNPKSYIFVNKSSTLP